MWHAKSWYWLAENGKSSPKIKMNRISFTENRYEKLKIMVKKHYGLYRSGTITSMFFVKKWTKL